MAPTNLLLLAAIAASPVANTAPGSVVQAMFDAFNRHDARGLGSLYAGDAILASSDFCGTRVGRAEVVRIYRALFQRFPDIHGEVRDMLVDGDRVAVRFVAKSGQGAGAVSLPIATFLHVKEGLIQSDESVFDTEGRPCEP